MRAQYVGWNKITLVMILIAGLWSANSFGSTAVPKSVKVTVNNAKWLGPASEVTHVDSSTETAQGLLIDLKIENTGTETIFFDEGFPVVVLVGQSDNSNELDIVQLKGLGKPMITMQKYPAGKGSTSSFLLKPGIKLGSARMGDGGLYEWLALPEDFMIGLGPGDVMEPLNCVFIVENPDSNLQLQLGDLPAQTVNPKPYVETDAIREQKAFLNEMWKSGAGSE